MKKIKAKESELVKQAAIELLENWKPYLFTITSDNGKEFAMHQEIAVLEVDFYFANPYSPWERGQMKSKWTYKAIYTQIDLF
jgi:IS30 family transposase